MSTFNNIFDTEREGLIKFIENKLGYTLSTAERTDALLYYHFQVLTGHEVATQIIGDDHVFEVMVTLTPEERKAVDDKAGHVVYLFDMKTGKNIYSYTLDKDYEDKPNKLRKVLTIDESGNVLFLRDEMRGHDDSLVFD